MRRDEVALSAVGLALFGVLVAVSWRATTSRADAAVILYVAGGVLEATGVVIIAVVLRAARAGREPRAAWWLGFAAVLLGIALDTAANIVAATA